jgi:hypothetical protein
MEVVPASGTVTLDGEPVEGVTVTFIPEGDVGGRGGYGVSDSQGNFSLQASPEVEGIPPGKYQVIFRKLRMPDGSPIPSDMMAADAEPVNLMPEKYGSIDGAYVMAEVPTVGGESLQFDLSTRGPRGR